MTANSKKFETVIGLEVHLQLNTQTKIFCGCANVFGAEPNTNTCPVCLGLPGSLPVFNKEALSSAVKVALALNCEVNTFIKFDRKNYYYPDLPKGYQISQFDHPIARNGFIIIPHENGSKKIGITRAHLEEDAGKLIHDDDLNCSLVNYNRTGTPLIEIVSEPDLRSPQEAYDYLQTLKLTLQYLNVSDCDMEKGSLRCDANVSIREMGDPNFGTKTELKNMNSFKAVKTAIEYEVNRQKKILLANDRVIQETRLWNEQKCMTFPMRSKEEAHDYRYFPEPDLVPFNIKQEFIDTIKSSLPELPNAKFKRLSADYKISEYDTQIIIQNPTIAQFFEECAKDYTNFKNICNWINGPVLQELNARKLEITQTHLTAAKMVQLIQKVDEDALSNLAAKEVLKHLIEDNKNVEQIIEEQGLAQVSDDSALESVLETILNENEKIVAQIKEGKTSAIGFLVGQAMKKTQGKANPKKIGELIKRRLS